MDDALFELRIGDLISVPEVQTVIDLSEARDLDPEDPESRVHLEGLSHDFVLTDDILKIFRIILEHIKREDGRGFFIIGNYGTGKSHLLSVLGLIARYSWAHKALFHRPNTPDDLKKSIGKKRILPVMIPLTEYSADLKLEKIFWHAAEKAAATAGIPLALSYTQLYINFFNRYILNVHEAEFRNYIKSRFDTVSWEQIYRDDSASAHTIILQFLEHAGLSMTFDPMVDRKEQFTELLTSVQASGWDGVLFLIDELSEFLQSKPALNHLHEDTRFLQFLGEASLGQQLWIVAAIQESLEMNRNITQDVFNKIKARYQHLKLSTSHLQQFISERLLLKKRDDATDLIGNIFDHLFAAFKRLPITKETFIQLYPIHPETLTLLDQNIDLFSRHRGLVDFLTTQIRGKPEILIEGILDEPCHNLLTPDTIFDHFQTQLADSIKYSAYLRQFNQNVLPKIQHRFDDKNDCQVAMKTMKTLFLQAISPFKEDQTVRNIANMMLYRVFETPVDAEDTNYWFFEERIIRVLFQDVGYLKRVAGNTRLDDVYQFMLDLDPSLTIEEQINQVKDHLAVNYLEIYTEIILSMGYGLFPLASFLQKTVIRESITWQNTRRRVAIRLIHLNEIESEVLDSIRASLLKNKFDIALILLFPGDANEIKFHVQRFLAQEPSEISNAWAFIVPTLQDSLDVENTLLDIQAVRTLEEEFFSKSDTSDQSDTFEILNERKEKALLAGRERLRQAYMSGWFYSDKKATQLTIQQAFDHFEKWLETILVSVFTNRYPDHYKVAPGMDCHSKIIQELLLDKFIRPGDSSGLNLEKDAILLNAIEKIAVTLGLAQKKSGVYYLTGSPSKSYVTQAIMAQFPPSGHSDLSNSLTDPLLSAGRVLLQAIKPPIGMSRPVFDLGLATLIRKGYVVVYKSGKKLTLDNLHLPLTGQIDKIRRGALIADIYRPAFFLLYKLLFNRHLAELDLDSQENAWKKLVSQIEIWKSVTIQIKEVIKNRIERFSSRDSDLKETLITLDRFDELVSAVDTLNPDLLQRWHDFLSIFETIEKSDQLFASLKKMKSFWESGFKAYSFAEYYLSELKEKIPDKPEYQPLKSLLNPLIQKTLLSDDLILAEGMNSFQKEWETFRNLYRQQYCDEHENEYHKFHNNPYQTIVQSQLFRLFNQLISIKFIGALQENRNMVDMIHRLKNTGCKNDPYATLEVHPLCSCGFTLGKKVDVFDLDTLFELLFKQVTTSFAILCSQIFLAELEQTEDRTKNAAIQSIQKILELRPEHPSFITYLEDLLKDDVVTFINHLYSTKKPAAVFSFKDFFCSIKGCTLNAGQAREKLLDLVRLLEKYGDTDWIRFDD